MSIGLTQNSQYSNIAVVIPVGTDDDDFGNIQLVAPSQDDILRGSWKPAVPPLGLMRAICEDCEVIIIFLISLPEPASRGWGEAAGAGHHQPGPAGRGQGGQGGGEVGGEAAPQGVAPPGACVPLRPLHQALLLPPHQGDSQTLLLLATFMNNLDP